MKKVKQYLAAALSAAMVLGSTITAQAVIPGWELEDGKWHLYVQDDNGEISLATKDKYKGGDWYSFYENGDMKSNVFFELKDVGDYRKPGIAYALPMGSLAENQWVQIKDPDKVGNDTKETIRAGWYYFSNGGQKHKENDDKPAKSTMVIRTVKKIGDEWYGFEPDGRMISAGWWSNDFYENPEDPDDWDEHWKQQFGEGEVIEGEKDIPEVFSQ